MLTRLNFTMKSVFCVCTVYSMFINMPVFRSSNSLWIREAFTKKKSGILWNFFTNGGEGSTGFHISYSELHMYSEIRSKFWIRIRGILIQKISEFPIGHAAKLFPLLHWFQNCFCFCSTTFPSHVGNFFGLQWEYQWENGKKSFFGNKIW